MPRRVSFSDQHLELEEIADHYSDVEAALRQFFSPSAANPAQIIGYTPNELLQLLEQRLTEQNYSTALSVCCALEAAFQIDYLKRIYQKKKDILSRAFRNLHKEKGPRVSVKNDILKAWRENTTVPMRLIDDLRKVFEYRDWLAHGRYWIPKLGKCHDYQSIYGLAMVIFANFPFVAD